MNAMCMDTAGFQKFLLKSKHEEDERLSKIEVAQ